MTAAVFERIAELQALCMAVPDVRQHLAMNQQILPLVEQVIKHNLCDEKKIRLIYCLMRPYRYEFALDDCSSFIPEGY